MSSVEAKLAEKKRDVFLSRASSRKELAGTLHDLILPAIQRLEHNDKVTQEVCKATLKALGDITERLNKIDPLPIADAPTTETVAPLSEV